MAKMYAAMILHTEVGTESGPINLPEGCLGIMFVFSTKKAARTWEGKDVALAELGLVQDVECKTAKATKAAKS